jgi:hypothetical protein
VVPVIEVADRPDPRDAVPVAELAAERVAAIWTIARRCGLAGWMSKYLAMRRV